MLLALSTVVGGMVGVALGIGRSDAFFGEIEIVVYGFLGTMIGVVVGTALYLLMSRR